MEWKWGGRGCSGEGGLRKAQLSFITLPASMASTSWEATTCSEDSHGKCHRQQKEHKCWYRHFMYDILFAFCHCCCSLLPVVTACCLAGCVGMVSGTMVKRICGLCFTLPQHHIYCRNIIIVCAKLKGQGLYCKQIKTELCQKGDFVMV